MSSSSANAGIVYNFVRTLYKNAHPGSKNSWRKLNDTLRKGLSLSIMSEMRFEKDEISDICEDMQGEYWLGEDEWILRLACTSGNTSAARSYLSWKGRKRFVWPKTAAPGHRESRIDLLYEGREFQWNGETVTVTSFNDEVGTLTACSHTGGDRFTHGSKVKRRYTLNPTDLKFAQEKLKVTVDS